MRAGVLSVCNEAGCSELVRGARCVKHKRQLARVYRNRSAEWSWVYRDTRWPLLRRLVLAEQPTCARVGCNNASTDVDHKVALADGGAPFDRANLHGLCKADHSAKTIDEIRRRGT